MRKSLFYARDTICFKMNSIPNPISILCESNNCFNSNNETLKIATFFEMLNSFTQKLSSRSLSTFLLLLSSLSLFRCHNNFSNKILDKSAEWWFLSMLKWKKKFYKLYQKCGCGETCCCSWYYKQKPMYQRYMPLARSVSHTIPISHIEFERRIRFELVMQMSIFSCKILSQSGRRWAINNRKKSKPSRSFLPFKNVKNGIFSTFPDFVLGPQTSIKFGNRRDRQHRIDSIRAISDIIAQDWGCQRHVPMNIRANGNKSFADINFNWIGNDIRLKCECVFMNESFCMEKWLCFGLRVFTERHYFADIVALDSFRFSVAFASTVA